MKKNPQKRRLSAILSADVVGYSRLMEIDEAWTIKNLDENRRFIGSFIEEYGGRVIDAIGDNILAEFNSVINSVECAVKIQQELKKKNDALAEGKIMQFRIGINLGDIVEEDGRIYGSGVNIASRLEGLAQPGGICISGRTYDHIKTKLGLGYKYLGEHNVKNISEPIRIYNLLLDPENAGKVIGEKKVPSRTSHRMAIAAVIILIIIVSGLSGWIIYSTKSKKAKRAAGGFEREAIVPGIKENLKSIAVLPFDDFSPENDQEYFVNGLSEEILNTIAQISDLTVIARTSSFSYKNSNKKVQEIANELGVGNILEGSVRKAGNVIRITAQLINAVDGSHFWSKTYDKELKDVNDILSIQEDIAASVADELKLTLRIGKSFKQLGETDNLEAYELYLVSKGQYIKMDNNQALKSIDHAIALDPGFALAWAFKSYIHLRLADVVPPDQASLEYNEAFEAARTVIKIDPSVGQAYISLAAVYSSKGDFIEAEKTYRKGVELTNEFAGDLNLFLHYAAVGYFKKQHELLEEKRRKDPKNPITRAAYMLNLGYLGDTGQAEKEYERCKQIFGDQWVYGDFNITLLRFGKRDALSIKEIPEISMFNPSWAILRSRIGSPEKGLAALRLWSSGKDEAAGALSNMSVWAAYFGDPEFSLNNIERYVKISTQGFGFVWLPVMHEVRQLPRFKELVREMGIVDYWKEYGWPDLCRPSGDDFECD